MAPEYEYKAHFLKTPGILAAWVDVGPVPQGGGQNVYLAVEESQFAHVYGTRRELVKALLPGSQACDLDTLPPSLWALQPEGKGIYLVLETWGEVPQRPRYRPLVIFDRTGRLRSRWQLHEPEERRPFAAMDTAISQAWFALWAVAWCRGAVAQGWYLAQATSRSIEFLSLAAGYPVTVALHLALLRHVPELADTLTGPYPLPERGRRLLRILSREMRRVASQLGWRPPYAFEAAAYAAWNLPAPGQT